MNPGIKTRAVIKKDNKYYLGSLEDDLFIEDREIKSPQDVENSDEFVSIFRFMEILGLDIKKKDIQSYLKKIGASMVYIYDPGPVERKDGGIAPSKWDNYFFRYINKKCRDCKKSCKQSSRVILDYCPEYKKID